MIVPCFMAMPLALRWAFTTSKICWPRSCFSSRCRNARPHCYLDPQLFRPDLNHGEQIMQLRGQLQKSNETFVIHYLQTY